MVSRDSRATMLSHGLRRRPPRAAPSGGGSRKCARNQLRPTLGRHALYGGASSGGADRGAIAILVTVLNFAAALAGLIAAWRWFQTTTIRPPTELSFGGPTTVDTGPLVAFVKEIGRLNRRAASWTAAAAFLEGLATIAHYYGV